MDLLKIAQVSPLYESVPPKYYGGTERIVSYLTEELVRQGHKVTLFASGDSVTQAQLISPCQQSLRLEKNFIDQMAYHLLLLEWVLKNADRFDIIHFHTDYMHFPLSRRNVVPQVTTVHGRLDIPELIPLYKEFREMPVVSISNAQRRPLSWINWQKTVYHGLPKNLYTFRKERGEYLAFLGRISPEKRVDIAIEIAKRTGMEIRIAAKVDAVDQEYFKAVIKPLFKNPRVKYLGEIGDKEKDEFLGNAYALLFPIDWPEPFGIVMIEAMACGTPVIAYRKGSVPEVIEDGVTGFVVENVGDAVKAVESRIQTLSRKQCREVFEKKFSATRMTEEYIKVYRRLLNKTIPLLEEGHINNGRDYPNQRPVLYSSNIIPD